MKCYYNCTVLVKSTTTFCTVQCLLDSKESRILLKCFKMDQESFTYSSTLLNIYRPPCIVISRSHSSFLVRNVNNFYMERLICYFEQVIGLLLHLHTYKWLGSPIPNIFRYRMSKKKR